MSSTLLSLLTTMSLLSFALSSQEERDYFVPGIELSESSAAYQDLEPYDRAMLSMSLISIREQVILWKSQGHHQLQIKNFGCFVNFLVPRLPPAYTMFVLVLSQLPVSLYIDLPRLSLSHYVFLAVLKDALPLHLADCVDEYFVPAH